MDQKPTILVVDDEFSIRESFNLILSSDYRVIQAASGEGALAKAAEFSIDLVYLDVRMPGMDGIETLSRIKEISPETEVIMVTAVNDMQKAAQAIKLGAYDYVIKPFDVDKILSLTEDILRRKGLLSVMRGIASSDVPQLISANEKVIGISKKIDEISQSENWVLICGENGVEKEWIAKLIHQGSNSGKSFVDLDLKGMSAAAIEKKLFGKIDAGTLFIDNIENLPNDLQVKLLALPIRVVAASTHSFSDLHFINEFSKRFSNAILLVPPLRERSSDIPLLLDFLFGEIKLKQGSVVKEIVPAAKDILSSYSWPGNMAELVAVVERLILIADGPFIEVDDLPLNILISTSSSVSMPLEENYSEFEKDFISSLLAMNSNNKDKTAKMLRVSAQVLNAKL